MMLREAFGLRRDPFMDTADPAFYFETMATANGRRRLYECLAGGRGLAAVVGPVGAGKTSLCNAVTAQLLADPGFLVALILDPTFADESELLQAIASSFGFDAHAGASPRLAREHLKRDLFEATTSMRTRQGVLIIDEAQLLPEHLLETLRALLNFQLDERKLLSIGLSGQMELAGAIARRPNLSDRVALWLELRPLSEAEAAGLIDHRLRCAGYSAPQSPFESAAIHAVWRASGGLPRRIGSRARAAMEVAAERGSRTVTARDVEDAEARIAPDRALDPSPDAPAIEVQQSGAKAKNWWTWWRRAS
jgi:type II secretory pathway predicted ATPase ExeA